MKPLRCHPDANSANIRDLGHLYQFDFDLYRCGLCNTPWVWAYSMYGSDWEIVSEEDANKMEALPDADLRPFMKVWASDFN